MSFDAEARRNVFGLAMLHHDTMRRVGAIAQQITELVKRISILEAGKLESQMKDDKEEDDA